MFRYAIDVQPDPEGGFVVTFPAFPGAVTQGETYEEAVGQAVDCLDEAIAACILAREPIPRGRTRAGEAIEPSPALAANAAFYEAARAAGLLAASALARRLGVAETEARRLLDPHHETRLSRLDAYMRELGWRMRIDAVDDAA